MVFNQLMPRLQGYEKPDRAYGEVTRRAAVAIVLHEADGELCLLMIRRAQREGDRAQAAGELAVDDIVAVDGL